MERLARQVQETQRLLADPTTDWKDCSTAIEELATAVESLRSAESYRDAVRLLLNVSVGIGAQLASIRSKLVKDVCEHLLRIVKVTGGDFQEMANVLMPQIVSTAKSSSAAIRQPGAKLLCKLSETVRYDVGLVRKIFIQLTQDKVRVLLLEQLRIILVYRSDDELTPWRADMLEMVRRGLEDQNTGVRTAAREVLTRISSRWRERVDELMDIPSNHAKMLIITEHRDSPLAEAIVERNPELANKSEMFSRSRSSPMKLRTSFRKSPRHKKSEQNIEIHVSATPPPKQRDQQDAAMQETASSELDTVITESVSAAETNIFDDLDDDEQENIPEAFDGSQMHGCRATSVKREIQQVSQLESTQIATGETAISSRTTVAQTTSVPSFDEVLPHPGVAKLKESKIPSPSNRSPSFLNKKHFESTTRTSSSPELRPSLLPRPGSFTLKSQGSSGPSTPVAAANVEEGNIEQKSLSASDEYFSKPIPSSCATPTPTPPSTDNVTLRPRRRAFFNQEHEEESSLQAFSPAQTSFEVEKSTQALQVEPTLEGVCSSPVIQEESPHLRENQYAGYTSDDVDDLSHLTEGSDQVESDREWNRHRLDDSESRSGDGGESVHGDTDEPEYSGDDDADADSEELGLDEGTRHKSDFEDEIGNRLSDDETKAASDAENEPMLPNSPQDLDVEWKKYAESSPKEQFSVRDDVKEEAQEEATPAKDTLEALLGVRDEMARLRAATRNEEHSYELSLKERDTPVSCAFDPSDTAEQSHQQMLAKHDEEPWDKPGKPYLARLQNAERFARSPLLAPPTDADPEQSIESNILDRLTPLQTVGQTRPEAATFDVDHDSSSEHDYLDLEAHSLSPSRVLEPISTRSCKEDQFDFVQEFRPAENRSPRAESNVPSPQDIAQPQETYFVREELEHAERFDAAEKLFAAKETPPHHGCYDRPQSPEPKLYMHSEPYQERLPPTQMGAILNPIMSPTPNVATEDLIINAAEEKAEEIPSPELQDTSATPQPDLKHYQQEANFAKRDSTPPATETTPVVSPSNPESVARPVSTLPTRVPERNAPPATLDWARSIGIWVIVFIAAMFCTAGVLRAAKTMRESYEYHQALKTRIDMFEASITESHEKVLKLEEDYAIWSEYVRKLADDDESSALRQLQAIQIEVQKWQQDMKADLVQFRQALSVDSIDAAFADLRANNTKQIEQ